MVIVAVQHKVADFEAWKKVFDQYPPKAGGALYHRINRLVSDPNTVAVVTGFSTVQAAEAFMSAPRLAEAMKQAGVIGAPRVEMYNEVEAVKY